MRSVGARRSIRAAGPTGGGRIAAKGANPPTESQDPGAHEAHNRAISTSASRRVEGQQKAPPRIRPACRSRQAAPRSAAARPARHRAQKRRDGGSFQTPSRGWFRSRSDQSPEEATRAPQGKGRSPLRGSTPGAKWSGVAKTTTECASRRSAVKASSEATQRTRRSREPSAPWAGRSGAGHARALCARAGASPPSTGADTPWRYRHPVAGVGAAGAKRPCVPSRRGKMRRAAKAPHYKLGGRTARQPCPAPRPVERGRPAVLGSLAGDEFEHLRVTLADPLASPSARHLGPKTAESRGRGHHTKSPAPYGAGLLRCQRPEGSGGNQLVGDHRVLGALLSLGLW